VNAVIDAAPANLNTLNELAEALGDDANYAATVTSSLATKADTTYVDSQIAAIDTVISQAGEPTGESTGALWFKTDEKILYIHNGTDFVPVYVPDMEATGGISTAFDGSSMSVFTSSGVWTPDRSVTIEVMIVAGGGGGGFQVGGGGGAGGLLYGTLNVTAGTAYTITVGNGGSGAANGGSVAHSGGNSTAFGAIAVGGGRGGNHSTCCRSLVGGSGGGAGADGGYTGSNNGAPANQGDSNTLTGFGNAGGNSVSNGWSGGGGGGAGGGGTNGSGGDGGEGGAGKNMAAVFGTAYGDNGVFASGGGGCNGSSYCIIGGRTAGGGGAGAGNCSGSNYESTKNGYANTGGGGGGTRDYSGRGGNGGSGIVIIKWG